MVKTPEQILYEEIRHMASSNYLVPKHLTMEQLQAIILIFKGDK